MHEISEILSEGISFRSVCDAVNTGKMPVFASGLSESHKAFLLMAFAHKLSKKAVLIVPDEERAEFYNDFFKVNIKDEDILFFPSRDYIFRNIESTSRRDEGRRIKALLKILKSEYKLLIITADALLLPVIPQNYLKSLTNEIVTAQEYPLTKLVSDLICSGYERCEITDGQGQFSVRGGIVDFFALDADYPVRIEYFGDEIELIGEYDPFTQRRVRNIQSARLAPALEVLPDKKGRERIISFIEAQLKKFSSKPDFDKTVETLKNDHERLTNFNRFPAIDKYIPLCFEKEESILDYISDDLIFSFEMQKIKEKINGFTFRINEELKGLIEDGIPLAKGDYIFPVKKVYNKLADKGIIMLETFARSENDIPVRSLCSFSGRATSQLSDIKFLAEDIGDCIDRGYKTAVFAGSSQTAARFSEKLSQENISAQYYDGTGKISKGAASVLPASIPFGFQDDDAKLAVFTNGKAAVSNKLSKPQRKRHRRGEKIHGFSDIHPGDYVVHIQYGIGIYEGIHKIEVDGVIKDFIKIKYARSDTLYIPCSQLDLISKYVGTRTDFNVKLNRLGTAEWQKTRQRVKHAVKDMAKELTLLYSERMKIRGHAFSPDCDMQREFEDKFEFEETDDQLKCTDEIKSDMQSVHPMDRLLCGDVGFGKTEVALRAVFKCIADGKQAALLVPTTILAWQHYNTILMRMEDFPIKVELLSRFRTARQQSEIIKELRKGRIDIVVGTHRLIQKDIGFKNLGLVIVDEEQRFGVAHKERLKEMTKAVDVLTLSATPIPRTLNMALAGIRDMSVIEEPPHDRHPVTTYVCEYDAGIIADALKREIQRGGQCYYLYNRVETIYRTADRLRDLIPEARIDVAHGQMNEDELALVWERLLNREIDILVCTTIIETGVDVPNVNTLIIEDSDRLGLSQLHQIRGRVGRSSRRAYAYFTYRRGKVLNEEASKRLSAIREFTEFGSGIKIAMRDLEIRGAGNILGAQQHGHMETVGYDLYLKLLEEAVREEKGEAPQPLQCSIDISISAYIPESFIESSQLRIDMYKRISSIESEEDVSDCIDEIIDRFGDPPAEVLYLIDIAIIRSMASKAGFYEISHKGSYVLLFTKNPDLKIMSAVMGEFKGKLLFSAGQKPYYSFKVLSLNNITKDLKNLIQKFLSAEENKV